MKREEPGAPERAKELLAFVGLDGEGETLAKNLPYGLQRRLEIARALATGAQFPAAGRATARCHPQETTEAIERPELAITILLIEHDMKVVMTISEHITVLDDGAKIAEGTPGTGSGRPESHSKRTWARACSYGKLRRAKQKIAWETESGKDGTA